MSSDIKQFPFIRDFTSNSKRGELLLATCKQRSDLMSDKKIRDQALISLREYLCLQAEISDLDLLKLWKGLWMQDKPALQQQLSRDLASLVTVLQAAVVMPFFRAFWLTMAREWDGIEALRLDKYLYLIRRYVHAAFCFLSRNQWNNTLVENWSSIVREVLLERKCMSIPNGLKYHVLDVWVEELEGLKVEWRNDDRHGTLELLMSPIEELVREGKSKAMRNAAKECLMDERLLAYDR